MPVYHFTFHTYGSWLPDKPKGYVIRGKGIQKQDLDEADNYRKKMTDSTVLLSEPHFEILKQSFTELTTAQRLRLHGYAMDPTHVHLLLSWHDPRRVLPVRTQIKRSLTMRLKILDFKRSKWWARDASQKRVRDQSHFDYLIYDYFPSHHQKYWRENQ